MKCDLHLHSTFSDGKLTPEQLVNEQFKKGLNCIAVSDHDTVDGIVFAQKSAQGKLQVIPAVELSAYENDKEVHVLAYNVDFQNKDFLAEMERVQSFRNNRNELMAQKLLEHGFNVNYEQMKAQKGGVIGRPDFAKELIKAKVVKNVNEAFDKYLGKGKSCYVKAQRLTPAEAIKLALKFGGIPVLAHPKSLKMSNAKFESFLKRLIKEGLVGIEADYFSHNMIERNFYRKMAKKYDLIVTGGSDYHDEKHGAPLGKSFSPNDYTKLILGIK